MSTKMFRNLVIGFSLALLLTPRLSAQADLLYDTWFKVKVQAKGVQVEDDESLSKATSKSVHYIHFLPPEVEGGGAAVSYELWSETAPDSWEIVDGGEIGLIGSGDLLFSDWGIGFGLFDGNGFGGYHTGMIKVKTDKEGALKKARLKSFGGETTDGTLDGEHFFAGSLNVTGKTVPVEKLPFVPKPV
jgi:hypothetical protein